MLPQRVGRQICGFQRWFARQIAPVRLAGRVLTMGPHLMPRRRSARSPPSRSSATRTSSVKQLLSEARDPRRRRAAGRRNRRVYYAGRPLTIDRRADRQHRAGGRPDSPARPAAARGRDSGPQLSRRRDPPGELDDQRLDAARHSRSRRAAGRRHFRHRPHAGGARRSRCARSGRARCARPCCCASSVGRKSTSSPITWRSRFPTCSSSATGWTITTRIAICPTWRCSTTDDLDGGAPA